MKTRDTSLLAFIVLLAISGYSQNLPSLLTDKNINATFSILAYDKKAKEYGIAIATNNIYVGNSTVYIDPAIGAFSVIAETEPLYAIEGFKNLKAGKSIKQAILEVKENDKGSHYRQVSGMDVEGNVYAFTGESLKYWNGEASEVLGENFVVIGNQLDREVLSQMSKAFKNTEGTLAERLLQSLIAGQNAGGQISGKQSAAIVVKGADNAWYNQIDLRVDNSKKPIKELQILMNYHYGRIRLNQALYAHREGNIKRAKRKLLEAESMLEGWDGIYTRIAKTNFILGDEDKAIKWIKKGLSENPKWSVNIPAFYFLRNNPEMKSIIKPDSFNINDWENAIQMLSSLGRELEVITLAQELLDKKIESSYLNFLLGRSYFYEKEEDRAIGFLEKALILDKENIEARILLSKIK
ncbi:DUF1028 domain-containing protein [uncultured Aquimarina sp.]|uniref:DUF1028 domain-containing protein n=1 Tax=uncultured Aquimarina sp. TaxID=575652 RepID=UPI0026280529|nr:DUF1028 domain-containing protein [uncultured Aquimarina sp.]